MTASTARKMPAYLVVLAILSSVVMALPSAAAERKLLTLESAPGNAVKLPIFDQPGLQRATPVVAFSTWKVKAGETLRTQKHPADRVVDLYGGTALAPSLLCRLVLRYYASDAGWVPAFRIDEEPLVARVNGRWEPVGGVAGLVRHGNTLPNAEGFFPTIEFGPSAGSLAIVAWQVH